MGTPLDPTNPQPVEPEVEARIPLEPQQLVRALSNLILGQRCERVFAYRSTKDGRERYVVVFANEAALLFAPAPSGREIVMTLIQEAAARPPAENRSD